MKFECHHCSEIVDIEDSEAGNTVGCGSCGQLLKVPESVFAPSAVVDDFVIRECLGTGGMGTVYLAHQLSLDRPVALKILMDEFSQNSEFVKEFVREARSAARLIHPNIVQSYAVGNEGGVYYFAMEYVKGQTLMEMMDELGPIPEADIIKIISQIAEALDFSWKNQQLIHRDVKPDNIMISERKEIKKEAKLADLGLARKAQETSDDDENDVMGTPQYICPEQLLGKPMDVRGDIYSLGATFFHAITGEFPYSGNSAAEIARKHLNDPVPNPRDIIPEISERTAYIIQKMMAKNPEDRYEDAEELVMDLNLVTRGQDPEGFAAEETNARKGSAGNKSKVKAGKNIDVRNTSAQKRTMNKRKGGSKVNSDQNNEEAVAMAGKPKPSSTHGGKKPRSRKASIETSKGSGKKLTVNKGGSSGGGGGRPRAHHRPGSPPSGNKGFITVMVILILLVVAVIGTFFHFYQKYNFQDSMQAKRFYLDNPELCSKEQRELYERIEVYIMDKDDLECEDVLDAWDKSSKFLTTYPNSPFSNAHEDNNYGQQYMVIGELQLFVDKIKPKAAEFAGNVKDNQKIFEELLVRCKRKERHNEALEQIKINQGDYLFAQTKILVLEELRGYVDKRKNELQERIDTWNGTVSKDQATFDSERKSFRTLLFEKTMNAEFDQGLRLISDAKPIPYSKYINPINTRVNTFLKKTELENVEETITRLLVRFQQKYADDQPRSMTKEELQEKFEEYAKESDFDGMRAKIAAMPGAQATVHNARNTWFENHDKGLKIAQAYFKRLAGTGDKFNFNNTKMRYGWPKPGYNVRLHKIKLAKEYKIEMMHVTEASVVFRVRDYKGMDLVILTPNGTETYPLNDFWHNPGFYATIRYGIEHFDDVPPEQHERPFFQFYAGILTSSLEGKLSSASHGLSSFLQKEYAEYRPDWINQFKEMIKKRKDETKFPETKAWYDSLVKKYTQ